MHNCTECGLAHEMPGEAVAELPVEDAAVQIARINADRDIRLARMERDRAETIAETMVEPEPVVEAEPKPDVVVVEIDAPEPDPVDEPDMIPEDEFVEEVADAPDPDDKAAAPPKAKKKDAWW